MKKSNRRRPVLDNRLNNQEGQGLTEYITLLLLVSVVSIVAARTLGGTIREKIEMAKRHIQSDITLEKR
jgi:Flp pilus assembly pilin Flp